MNIPTMMRKINRANMIITFQLLEKSISLSMMRTATLSELAVLLQSFQEVKVKRQYQNDKVHQRSIKKEKTGMTQASPKAHSYTRPLKTCTILSDPRVSQEWLV